MGDKATASTFSPILAGWSGRLNDPRSRLTDAQLCPAASIAPPMWSTLPMRMSMNPQAPAARNMCMVGDTPQPIVLTPELLIAMVPKMSAERAQEFIGPLNLYLARYEINSVRRVAAFLGQVVVESKGFSRLTESLSYSSAERLMEIFPSKFGSVDSTEGYVKKPEKLANYIYANKLGNGDVASGDGWKYRGRGLIQLTGKYNYKAFQTASGVGVVNSPELLTQPTYAVMSAAWFWHSKGLNGLADSQSYKQLTLRVNAKALGFHEREEARQLAEKVLNRASLTGPGGFTFAAP